MTTVSGTGLSSGVPEGEEVEETTVELPVARVAVDVSLSHLDRTFDYAVTAKQDLDAVPGARVRVRFAGRLRDGYILERVAETDHQGKLADLNRVISAEPVLTPEIARLIRKVADHYAGCFADVMRLAVPPRHAATEKAERSTKPRPAPPTSPDELGPLRHYPAGPAFVEALRRGDSPRAAWPLVPTAGEQGSWVDGFAIAAAATIASGRGVVAIVPDQRDLERLKQACTKILGRRNFEVLTADLGPSARYRAFLSALRGEVRVVIGTRAAAFAPVQNLGLVALWDDGDDLLSEPRAPYPHARDVLVLRAAEAKAAVLMAGYGRSCEIQSLVQQGWLRELSPDRVALRHAAPRVRVTADSDIALERDPIARATRLPREVFEVIRAALPQGPVLVQVPRAGYLVSLTCQTCRDPVRCQHCSGPTRSRQTTQAGAAQLLDCLWCGRLLPDWRCGECGSTRWRAPVVGSVRTAEELGRAFPHTPVRQSAAGRVLADIPAESMLVVATPGAEPVAEGGYAGAVLLDTPLLLMRADLRASEEALRRWFNATALVRGGEEGGSVIAVGESSSRPLQALVRLDADGFAGRELVERSEAHFPPAAKMIMVEGRAEAVAEFVALAHLPEATEVLGPVEIGPNQAGDVMIFRLTLRAPRSVGAALVHAVTEVQGVRSARKSEGALRVRVDPVTVG